MWNYSCACLGVVSAEYVIKGEITFHTQTQYNTSSLYRVSVVSLKAGM
jgi:hypothetical protein